MKGIEALFIASRAAALKGKPLKLRQAAAIVIMISGIVLLIAIEGVDDILAGRKHHALFYCGLAVLGLLTLPIHVHTFLRVKRGEVVPNPWLVFGPAFEFVRVPLSVKITLVGALTSLVAVVSYLSLSPLHFHLRIILHHHVAFNFFMIVIGFNLFLWVVVALAWYLFVLTHKSQPFEVKLPMQHGEDVWPPAPIVGAEENNKDWHKLLLLVDCQQQGDIAMNVSLTPELESLVHDKVNSGLYTSASEVVREALRLLNDRDTIQQQRMAELKREIAIGLEDFKLGRTVSGEQVFAESRQRGEVRRDCEKE